MPAPQANIADEVFAGGGEMGALMRALDWSNTPLGPVEQWPQSLRTTVGICLNSRFAILIRWGSQLVMLYNDAFCPYIGAKHPAALGSPGSDVWPEIRDIIGPKIDGVMQHGESSWSEDLLLLLERNGYAEECYFTVSCSPIRDESGVVAGVFTPVVETTERVIGERRLRTLRDLAAAHSGMSMARIAPFEVFVAAVKRLSTNSYDLPFVAIYLFDQDRKSATSTVNTGTAGLPARIDFSKKEWAPLRAVPHGETCTIDLRDGGPFKPFSGLSGEGLPNARSFTRTSREAAQLPQSIWGIPVEQAIAVPIKSLAAPVAGEAAVGFLLAGVNPRKRLDDSYLSFYSQVAEQVAIALREAKAFEYEKDALALAEGERSKFRDLFFNAPAAIAITEGAEHRFTLANDRYVRLVGHRSTKNLIGKSVAEALPKISGQGILELLDRVYRTGVPYIGNEMPIRLDRSPTGQPEDGFFDCVYQPNFDADGRVEGILIFVVEITDQVRARQEIETREEQFRVLADSIPQLAWMAHPDGHIFWYNRRWYEYTGTTPEQMEGWGWQSVHDPEVLPAVLARYKHSFKTGEPLNTVFPLRSAAGEFRNFLTLALPVRDAAGKIVSWVGTNTDVESQRRAEAAMRQSEKLAVAGRLAASIAHEINNPLEVVINLVYLAQITAVSEEAKKFLNTAQEELARVAQITSQTLRFHRQQTAPASTDIAELLQSILAFYRRKVSGEHVQLQLEIEDPPQLVCYAGEIRQVLANLIGNALDAMPKGGTLRLRARPATDWRTRQPGVRITIADTGQGMSAETRRRIYEPFFTTKGETGTGLGLWVSAEIVEKHRGSIHVRSRLDAGTVFTLIFPCERRSRPRT